MSAGDSGFKQGIGSGFDNFERAFIATVKPSDKIF